MPSPVQLSVEPNRPYVPASRYDDNLLYALLMIAPSNAINPSAPVVRPRLNLVLIVDSSGTMYNFQLSPQERQYWLSLALSRNEMERGTADNRDAVYWGGQTLTEMESVVRKPMTLAVDAIKQFLSRLEPGDKVSVVAFADQTYTVFSQSDWTTRPDYCFDTLDDLLAQRHPFEIGTGTKMGMAIQQASTLVKQTSNAEVIDRIIVLSDGIIQDRRDTFQALEEVKETGFAVSTIGIGDEFDEEFLMRIADTLRGDYYYAASSEEITDKLLSELIAIKSSSMQNVMVGAQGQGGAMIQDVYMVSPSMHIFDEMDSDGSTLRARIGDIQSDKETFLLFQIAPALNPEGEHPVAGIVIAWEEASLKGGFTTDQSMSILLNLNFTDDPDKLAERDPFVQDIVDRFMVYKLEREAQRAKDRGDIGEAREKLAAATRELEKLGEMALASDLAAQIAAFGDPNQDPALIKRIKATTRKLGERAATGQIRSADTSKLKSK